MIYTLNARGFVMLQVMKQTFDLDDLHVYNEINNIHLLLCELLNKKGIKYEGLKSALIPPHGDKFDIAFVFDSSKIADSWYGYTVFDSLIPALNKESTYSILVGDIIADSINQLVIKKLLFENMIQCNDSLFQHSTQYYVVYINNLTLGQIANINEILKDKSFYIGYIDMTFNSILKTIIAHCLAPHAIKHKNIILLQDETHIGEDEYGDDINVSGYTYEENGFIVKSINSECYGLFLSYKIESIINDNDDIRFSFNAIHPSHDYIFDFPLSIQEAKVTYLKENKTEILRKVGLIDYSSDELEKKTKKRIEESYLYNLEYLEEYNVPKFNVTLELNTIHGGKRKVIVALKYVIDSNELQLITMY